MAKEHLSPVKKQIFRQSSLDRLSSPEQLDMVFQVVHPAFWFALLAVILLLAALIVWGFYGTVATKVSGQGIILRQGALAEAPSPGTGRIEAILVDVDDPVTEGEIIARLAQPELRHQIAEMIGKLGILRSEKALGIELGDSKKTLESEYLTKRRKALKASLEVAREQARVRKEQLDKYDELYRKEYISRGPYLDAKDKYTAILQDILTLREKIAHLPMTAADSTSQLERQKIDVNMRLLAAEEQLAALNDRLELETSIRIRATGRVLEIFKTPGQFIQAGEALLSVERANGENKPLYVQVYVQPRHGKKILPGMEAQISPSVVKQEEFGVLRGLVTHVSRFPASLKGMLRTLGNDQLVQGLSQGGSPITVTVALETSDLTESGYVWSSGEGPPITLQSGTLCGATVVVRRQPPVTLVLPFLKKFFLGVGETSSSDDGESHE